VKNPRLSGEKSRCQPKIRFQFYTMKIKPLHIVIAILVFLLVVAISIPIGIKITNMLYPDK
jgi:hypothetical protein